MKNVVLYDKKDTLRNKQRKKREGQLGTGARVYY
jgi:hypothetical protein